MRLSDRKWSNFYYLFANTNTVRDINRRFPFKTDSPKTVYLPTRN